MCEFNIRHNLTSLFFFFIGSATLSKHLLKKELFGAGVIMECERRGFIVERIHGNLLFSVTVSGKNRNLFQSKMCSLLLLVYRDGDKISKVKPTQNIKTWSKSQVNTYTSLNVNKLIKYWKERRWVWSNSPDPTWASVRVQEYGIFQLLKNELVHILGTS